MHYMPYLTEKEALNFAIFVNEIFKLLQNYENEEWLKTTLKKTFDQEFEKKHDKYIQYIEVMYFSKFATRISYMSDTPMQIICALTILNKLKDIFPRDRR